jgi:hypothetical protein
MKAMRRKEAFCTVGEEKGDGTGFESVRVVVFFINT